MDNIHVKSLSISDLLKTKFKTYLVYFIISTVVLLCLYSLRLYFNAQKEQAQLQQEVRDFRAMVDTFNQNKQVSVGNIDKHNQLLLSIIPEKEDYFSILIALERLSQQTGFLITKYTLDMINTNSDKLSLSIEGEGDTDTFLKFLQQYRFEGGRLITNETLEFGNNNSGTIRLSLNFYHKSLANGKEQIERITQKEVDFIDNIANKIDLSFTEQEDESNIEYETKTNPF